MAGSGEEHYGISISHTLRPHVAAAMTPGTLANRLSRPEIIQKGELRIGHPAGVITPEGKVEIQGNRYFLRRATVDRTARCLMRGYAFIPKAVLHG